MNIRRGFLQIDPHCWVRIDAILMVYETSAAYKQKGAQSIIYTSATSERNGDGVLCAASVDEVMAVIELYYGGPYAEVPSPV